MFENYGNNWYTSVSHNGIIQFDAEYDMCLDDAINLFKRKCTSGKCKWGYLIKDVSGAIVYTYYDENINVIGMK